MLEEKKKKLFGVALKKRDNFHHFIFRKQIQLQVKTIGKDRRDEIQDKFKCVAFLHTGILLKEHPFLDKHSALWTIDDIDHHQHQMSYHSSSAVPVHPSSSSPSDDLMTDAAQMELATMKNLPICFSFKNCRFSVNKKKKEISFPHSVLPLDEIDAITQ